MTLPENLKNYYLEWLQELLDGLSAKQEQLSLTYAKARTNLRDTDGVFYYPKDLKKVKGIGDTIVRRLEEKLHKYCQDNNIEPPPISAPRTESLSARGTKRGSTELRVNLTGSESPPKKKQRKYIPKKRSGGYAILLSLLEQNAIHRGIAKERVIEGGQKYCDHSLSGNFATKEYYGAWSSITSLKKHDLVLEEGRPKLYSLTEAGLELANTLKVADAIIFPDDKIKNSNTRLFVNDADSSLDMTVNLSELLRQDKNIQRQTAADLNSSFIDITFQNQTNTPSFRTDDYAINSRYILDLRDKSTNSVTNSVRRKFNGVNYEIWRGGTYEIYPIIDHREVKAQNNRDFFSKTLATKGIKSDIRQLPLGDIVWVAKNIRTGSECLLNTIIERKRLDDLAYSIRDNRFMEQKNRLEKSGCTNKYYLIEESIGSSLTNMAEALKTALWLILIYYRFSVIRTSNADQTVEQLQAIHSVISHYYARKDLLIIYPNNLVKQDDYTTVLEDFKKEFSSRTNIECCHTFACYQEMMGKNELRTVGDITIQILLYIKGISLEKAIAIQSIFPTLNHILTAYRDCKSEQDAKMLMFRKLGEAPGNKKITKNLSEKIAEVFYST
ncbi:hypothetical protein KAFR_0E03660 [Kazachstania africana CBS 2517]|uniref:Crossover junction endonuclease MUS81 n=1 Tax=Kazachstania africana (strain ATCC 22294 / BCRC 22015 / CBS 2517 / CECT 1963 / NBRC 1671 / NRRL Y-8276) TaxID=1071382 RepID=H2AVW7_KAZAF|nr:hypothetical protein KAFR_0E03660 [Kazachstania africana CBS 2517]CCF58517.1 hypothetical protein KAFR_0E03660 [Kazachstania africana CBS 2517]